MRELLTQHSLAWDAYAAALACAPEADRITRSRLHRKIGKTLENEQAGYARVLTQYEAAEALLGTPDRDDAGADWWEEWCAIQLEYMTLLYWSRQPDAMAERIGRVRPFIQRRGTPAQHAELLRSLNRQLNLSNRFSKSDTALVYARGSLGGAPTVGESRAACVTSVSVRLQYGLAWRSGSGRGRTWQVAFDMAEQIGELTLSLQALCLAHLTVAHRRQGRVAEVERSACRGLAVAEAAGMLDYIGANRAGLAWVRAARGRPGQSRPVGPNRDRSLAPLRMALHALLAGALAADRRCPGAGSPSRRHLHAVAVSCSQPNSGAPAGHRGASCPAALVAWDAGQPDEARHLLHRARPRSGAADEFLLTFLLVKRSVKRS